MLRSVPRLPHQPSTARARPGIQAAAAGVAAALALAALPALAAPAHQHGAATLNVSLDGATLGVALEMPLDNLVGFERAPRTDAERKAAAAALKRLREDGLQLFGPDAAAGCKLASAEVEAPVLEATPAAAKKDPHAHAGKGHGGHEEEHGDLDADYRFQCAQPAQLKGLTLGLFDAFPRLQRLNVQVAGPGGQHKASLKRPAKQVLLQR